MSVPLDYDKTSGYCGNDMDHSANSVLFQEADRSASE